MSGAGEVTGTESGYNPIRDGIDRAVSAVRYSEVEPPLHLAGLVHRYWELRTVTDLPDEFLYRAVPDACVNILFNQIDTTIAGVTALRTKAEVLNLGTSFHYVGIQFYPGVWQGRNEQIFDRYVGNAYSGTLPLIDVSRKIAAVGFDEKLPTLTELVQWLLHEQLITLNIVTGRILSNLDRIRSVADMARLTNLSPRQLQRTLKRTTGLAPHDLLKVLRVQQSFRQHYLDLYSDQSHYIHSFRKVTGYTPRAYADRYDV